MTRKTSRGRRMVQNTWMQDKESVLVLLNAFRRIREYRRVASECRVALDRVRLNEYNDFGAIPSVIEPLIRSHDLLTGAEVMIDTALRLVPDEFGRAKLRDVDEVTTLAVRDIEEECNAVRGDWYELYAEVRRVLERGVRVY